MECGSDRDDLKVGLVALLILFVKHQIANSGQVSPMHNGEMLKSLGTQKLSMLLLHYERMP